MGRALDLTGHKFGRLTALNPVGKQGGNVVWLCDCVCKNQVRVSTANLRRGHTQSCGCLHKEVTASRSVSHGATKGEKFEPLYYRWTYLKQRCENPNASNYPAYGGSGVKVCKEWSSDYTDFRDYMLSLPDCPVGACTPGVKLDREIDRYPNKNGDYKPGNVRWATRKQQMNNVGYNKVITVKTAKGMDRITLTEAVEQYATASYSTVRGRLSRGWSIKNALLTP